MNTHSPWLFGCFWRLFSARCNSFVVALATSSKGNRNHAYICNPVCVSTTITFRRFNYKFPRNRGRCVFMFCICFWYYWNCFPNKTARNARCTTGTRDFFFCTFPGFWLAGSSALSQNLNQPCISSISWLVQNTSYRIGCYAGHRKRQNMFSWILCVNNATIDIRVYNGKAHVWVVLKYGMKYDN